MSKRFDYFVVFAEMRTGSNFLEANINGFPALSCLGEAFNPHFIGYPNREDCLGVTEAARNAEPHVLIDAVKNAQGLAGFRFFHDHEPRVLESILNDARCAKIILTRNPVESYVSWKIAQETGQWKLTNVAKRKDAKATFDLKEFDAHLKALQAFQLRLMKALQTTGQTAFYVAYEDLQDVEVMNGLATFLEQPDRLERLDRNLKRQNPEPLSEKVENFEEMEAALASADREAMKTEAHQIKGTAGAMGYPLMTRQAGIVEDLLKVTEPDWDRVRSELKGLGEMIERALAAAKTPG